MNLRQRRPPQAEINLTALIDVVFLLLIFFMVSTTFEKETRLEIELPRAATEAAPSEEDMLDLVIDREGHFFVNERQVISTEPKSLKGAINRIADGRTDLPVKIRADAQAPYQAVITAMDVLTQLGLTHMSFIATRTQAGE